MNNIQEIKKYCCPAWYFNKYQSFCIRKNDNNDENLYYKCIHFNNRDKCWIRFINSERDNIISKYSKEFMEAKVLEYGYFKGKLIEMITLIFKLHKEYE